METTIMTRNLKGIIRRTASRHLGMPKKQLVKALPKLAKAAESKIWLRLAQSFGRDAEPGYRLEESSASSESRQRQRMQGDEASLKKETRRSGEDKGPLRDLAIIAGAQRVEHTKYPRMARHALSPSNWN